MIRMQFYQLFALILILLLNNLSHCFHYQRYTKVRSQKEAFLLNNPSNHDLPKRNEHKFYQLTLSSLASLLISCSILPYTNALESGTPQPSIINSINSQTSRVETTQNNNFTPKTNKASVETSTSFTTKKKPSDQSSLSATSSLSKKPRQSQWDLLRQKRTAAIKDLQQKGFIQIDTDNDSGKQVIFFPWIPDQKIPYKQLSSKQRLINEVSAGAFGEISKDSLLHWVDTLKTRKQAEKKKLLLQQSNNTLLTTESSTASISTVTPDTKDSTNIVLRKALEFKSLYAGFPIVVLASIPQGGSFFLLKKGILELQSQYLPQLGSNYNIVVSMVSISAGVMAYWFFRTPAELIKTQIQTRQEDSVLSFFTKLLSSPDPSATISSSPTTTAPTLSSSNTIRATVPSTSTATAAPLVMVPTKEQLNKIFNLWKYYPVMLSLDIPFQIINFILFGIVNDYLQVQHIPQTIWIRLMVGIGCGTIAAFLTCPLDVGKTRILARDKERQKQQTNQIIAQGSSSESLDSNMVSEIVSIFQSEGLSSLFLGLRQRLLYTGLANGIRLAAYGTSRMDLMMRALDGL